MDFGKKFRTLTVLPFLAAVMIASALSPLTNVVVVNAREMGTEYAQPWRHKSLTGVDRVIASVRSRVSALIDALRGHPWAEPALMGAAVLALALMAPEHAAFAGVMVLGKIDIKAARQNEADLREAQKTAKQERAAIVNAALARDAGKRTMTEEENKNFLALGTKIEGLDTEITQAAAMTKAAEEALAAEREETPVVDPDTKASNPKHTIQVEDVTKKPGYFGRQLQAVYNFACQRGQMENLSASDRDALKPMIPTTGIKGAATGASSDVGSDGGFLVSQDRSSTVLQRAYAAGEILMRLSPIPISANSNGIVLPAIDETSRADGSRYGGIVSGWLGQGNTLTSGKPKFRPMDLKLRKVGAFVYATDELLADARALEAWVNKYLPLELKFRTEDAVVNGTGSNQPLGVLNSGAVITVTRAQANRILSDDLRAMYLRMWAPLRSNAVFLIDQSSEGEFDTLAIPIGTGGAFDPSYKPAGSVPGQKYATYKGIPIVPVEYCAALGTSGDIVLVAFDEYTLIDKGDIKSDVSLHVAFLTDEQVFRFMYRVDGQCNWNAALTPKSGGSTLSCVVKLS
jgi:HK97 family phage major capsid protein